MNWIAIMLVDDEREGIRHIRLQIVDIAIAESDTWSERVACRITECRRYREDIPSSDAQRGLVGEAEWQTGRGEGEKFS